jgi:hypothetical protein
MPILGIYVERDNANEEELFFDLVAAFNPECGFSDWPEQIIEYLVHEGSGRVFTTIVDCVSELHNTINLDGTRKNIRVVNLNDNDNDNDNNNEGQGMNRQSHSQIPDSLDDNPIYIAAYNKQANSEVSLSQCPKCDAPINVLLGLINKEPELESLCVCVGCRAVLQIKKCHPLVFSMATADTISDNILELSELQNHLKQLDKEHGHAR